MTEQSRSREDQKQEVQWLLAEIEAAAITDAWSLCKQVEDLPDSYRHAVDVFRAGLQSRDGLVQMVSANSIVRFAARESWVLPELEKFLLREERDVLSASIALQALQSIPSCDSARIIAGVVDRTILAPIRLSEKASIITYALRSLTALGGIALNERSAFREAIAFFEKKFEGLWSAECFWEFERFIEHTQADLLTLSRARPLMPLAALDLSAEKLQQLPHSRGRSFGEWHTVMDSYCSLNSAGLSDRLKPMEAGREPLLGFARVVVLEHQRGDHAAIVCSDEAAVLQGASSIDDLLSMLVRFVELDPTGTHSLVYDLGVTAPAPYGTLMLRSSPSARISSASELFADQLGAIRQFLFDGRELPACIAPGIEAMRRDQN